jgi:hypothetical protein
MSIFVDSVGIEINLAVVDHETEAVIPITAGLGTLTLIVQKPDNTYDTWTPVVVDGPNGTAQYVTVVDDLNQVGTYILHGHWDPVSAAQDFYADLHRFNVLDRPKP